MTVPSSPPFAFLSPLAAALGLDRAGLWHGSRMALAAWLAFAVAAAAGLPNPFWAAMPVWVVAQNSRGLLIERAIWRLAGTLVGAAVGFALLHVLPAAVPPLLLVLALWVALCAAGMHLIRGVAAYGVMLAGITASVVILPAVIQPEQATELAVSRVICTLIGVLMVTLVTGLFTPAAPRRQYVRDIAQLAQAIAAQDTPPAHAQESAWMAAIAQMENNITPMTAGSWGAGGQRRRIEAVLQAAVAALAAWRVLAARPAPDPDTSAAQGTTAPTLPHDAARQRLARARRQLAAVNESLLQAAPAPRAHAPALEPYRDWTRARYAGALAGLATLLSAWLGTLWPGPEGELTALGVSIFSMVLGSLPMPHMAAPKLLAGVAAGVALATIYRLFVQPYANTGLAPLLLTLAPFLLLGGLARASRRPWIAMPSLDANMCFLLASQAGLATASTASILLGGLALVLAAAVVAAGAICLPEKPRRHALEALQALQSGLRALLADRPGGASVAGWQPLGIRHTLRLAAYWQYLAGRDISGGDGASPAPSASAGPLDAFNLNQAAADLQARLAAPGLAPATRPVLERAWQILRDHGVVDPALAARQLQALDGRDGPLDEASRLLLDDAARTLRTLAAAPWLPRDQA